MKIEIVKQKALTALKECLEKVPFVQLEQFQPSDSVNEANFQVTVQIQGQLRKLLIETKNNGQPRIARLAIYQLKEKLSKETDSYGIFIAPYISTESGKICEEAGIGYLDLTGNCLISFETVYISQEGSKNSNLPKRDLRSLYSPKGERVLRVLLKDPKHVWKMAALAQAAEVSLGHVANIKKLLLDRIWLSDSPHGISLTNPEDLLSEWGQSYNFLRNESRECYALSETPDIEAQIAETCSRIGAQYALTGFSSAARIAPMVRYQKTSVYVKGDVESLIDLLGWKVVTSGANVNLLIPYDEGVFFGAHEVDEITIVSSVQTYLDLQSVHGRGQEAAVAVRKELEKVW